MSRAMSDKRNMRHSVDNNSIISHAKHELEAVISNYSGIIMSVNKDDIITLFDGLHRDRLGLDSKSPEGETLDAVFRENRYSEIPAKIRKTFTDGPQDWTSEISGAAFHMRTTPIFDGSGRAASVVCGIDDITDIVRLQSELKSALRKAQSANRAKSDFLARMSHEMRTPLNAIIGLSELTFVNDNLSAEALSNIEKIYNAGTTLLNTVNDLLDISKIEAGRLDLAPEKYDIPSLINNAVSQSISHIGMKSINFILDVDENLPARLYGDDLKVKQIITNLLSNAFKYTKRGTVKLSLRFERECDTVWMTISVADTGIGIKPAGLNRLFSDYTQMNTAANREVGGTGLGLAITKKLAEQMDGSITVESEYGKGSVFTVKIRQKFVSDAIVDTETIKNLIGFKYSYRSYFRHGADVRSTLPRIPYARVLVVDDIAVNLDVARGMLKPYGMQVDCVTSGQQAIEAIRDENVRYNAIFMDHMMPGMDGIKTVKVIREKIGTEYAETIPIIALTANAIPSSKKKFLKNGFQDFLSKPIEMVRLDSVVQKWVRDVKMEESLAGHQAAGGQALSADCRGKNKNGVFDRRKGIDRRKASGGEIAWLDVEKGIKRFGSDREAYMQILQSFVISTRSLLEVVKDVTEDNLADYAITIHGIKGSSRSICADVTGNLAEALEHAAKDGNFSFVCAHNMDFIKTVEELLEQINDIIDKTASDNPKSKKDKPDTETLSALLTACKEYYMDGVDAAMAEMESYEYESGGELIAWLRSNVDQMNFKQIEEKLSALIGSASRRKNGN